MYLQTCMMQMQVRNVGHQLTIRAKRKPVLGVDIAYLSVLLSGQLQLWYWGRTLATVRHAQHRSRRQVYGGRQV